MKHVSNLDIQLTADMPAGRAVAIILQTLFADMRKNRPGILQDGREECLHDFRIAIRRTRSALSQLRHALPAKKVERFLPEFNWLGLSTGPVRDLDVYLLGFDDDQAMLPAGIRAHLLPLKGFLVRCRATELQKLKQDLDSERYRRLMVDWQGFIDGELAADAPISDTQATPIQLLANRQIGRMYRRVLRQGKGIDDDASDEQLHELRKSCKKLRYLLEFFANIYPEKAVFRQVKVLKKLQDTLGMIHDLTVQCAWLGDARHEMQTSGPPVEQAMDTLQKGLHKRRSKARKKFVARFGEFSDKKHRRAMRLMLREKPSPEKAA